MRDEDRRRIIRKHFKGLNGNAINRVLQGFARMDTEQQVVDVVREAIDETKKYPLSERLKHLRPKTDAQAIASLNEVADELAWEAAVS